MKILDSDNITAQHVFPQSKWSSQVILDKSICHMIQRAKYSLMSEVSKYALGYKYYLNELYKLADVNWWVPS